MKPKSPVEAVLTAPEAAKRYGLSRRHVFYLVSTGVLVGRKAGGTWLIDAASLKAYMARPRPRGRPKHRKR